VQEQTYQINYW